MMNLLTPNTPWLKTLADRRKYLLMWRITLFFVVVFGVITTLNSIYRGYVAWPMAFAWLVSFVCLIWLIKTRNFKPLYWFYALSGTILAQFSLNLLPAITHYVDFIWLSVCVMLALIGLGRVQKNTLVLLNFFGLTYFFFFGLNNHIEILQERTTYELISEYTEVLFALFAFSYLVHEFNTVQNHAEVTLQLNTNELLKVHRRLKRALVKEKQLNQLKSQFVSTTSHQFRTPMTVIRSNAEILEMIIKKQENIENSDKLTRSTNRIITEIMRMTNLMDEILILEKIASGKQTINLEMVDLIPLVTDIVEQFNEIQKDDRKIEFLSNSKEAVCLIDSNLLNHALSNLINNALKYSAGKKSPKVSIIYNGAVTISVKDHGIGIPESEMKNLFGRFYRASNTTEIEGTGLGLNIAKEYVEMCKGNLIIESVEHQGTTATITFPIIEESTEDKP